MAAPLRHRQTKEAATDMLSLKPPRHIPTLPFASVWPGHGDFRSAPVNGQSQERWAGLKGANDGSALMRNLEETPLIWKSFEPVIALIREL